MPDRLRRYFELIDVANALSAPLLDSVSTLLEISAGELSSSEASVLLRDGDDGDLRFICVIGAVADQLMDVRVPAGKGIAGFVFSSGQPMVVSDVGVESSFYSEIDRSTGYSTQMILATPLAHNGEVIGVLEYVNRRGDPPYLPFSPEDMDKAAHFAVAIASLVSAYEAAMMFKMLHDKLLAEGDVPDSDKMREWVKSVRGSTEHKEMMDIAVLVRELATRGIADRRLVRRLLESLIDYSDEMGENKYLNF